MRIVSTTLENNAIQQDSSGVLQDLFRIHSGFIRIFKRIHSGFINLSKIHPGFIKDSSGYIQDSFWIYPGFIQGLFVVIKRFTTEILKPTSLPLLDPSSWNSLTSLLPLFFNCSWGTAGFCWRKLAASAPTWVKSVALFYSKKPKWTFDILGYDIQCDPSSTYRIVFKVFIKFCFIFILFWDICF